MSRYRRVRSHGRHVERICAVARSSASATTFVAGTTMLATNTITASPHEPVFHRYTMPERMVSLWWAESCVRSMTGSTFAGT